METEPGYARDVVARRIRERDTISDSRNRDAETEDHVAEIERRDDRYVDAIRKQKREAESKSRNREAETESRPKMKLRGGDGIMTQRKSREWYKREPTTQLPAWPQAPSIKARIRAPPPNSGCPRCAREGRASQRDLLTHELPPGAGVFPKRASREAEPANLHGAAGIGHNAHPSRPTPEQRRSPHRGGRGRNSERLTSGVSRHQRPPPSRKSWPLILRASLGRMRPPSGSRPLVSDGKGILGG